MANPKPDPNIDADDLPGRAGVDWQALGEETDDISPEELEVTDELTDFDDDSSEELPEEGDDNPYQESDEALPDDEEEAAIRNQNRREAGDPV